MPKYAVHMIVLEEVAKKLGQSTVGDERAIADLIDKNKQAALLGSVGPDLFFWAPDYDIVKKPLEFYKKFRWLIELYNNTIGLVNDAIEALEKPVEDAVSSLAPNTVKILKSLINQIEKTISTFKSTLATGLFAGVFTGYDFMAKMGDLPTLSHTLFDYFTPPLQDDQTEGEWYWFDMLHYRLTGKFAQNLVELATTDEEKAFAYGYLTHVATDTTGHPYVNEIVGGPWRLHPQRHATCENFIDTWEYSAKYNENINSTLHDREKLPKSKELYDLEFELSDGIANLIHSTFLKTYGNLPMAQRPMRINKNVGANSGFLKVEDIQDTYAVFCFVMEVLGRSHVERPEEPFSGILDILNKMLKDFKEPPSPPSISTMCSIWDILSFGLTAKSRDCYENFAKNVAKWFQYISELIKWSFETILHLLDMLLTVLLSLPIAAVMAILYGLQLLLYSIYRQARFVLALNGFVYPEPDEVHESSFGRALVTPHQCIKVTGGPVPDLDEFYPNGSYPYIHSHKLNHLQCPDTPSEAPPTISAWYSRSVNTTPSSFIRDAGFNEADVKQYTKAADPNATRNLEKVIKCMGNSVDFAAWMMKNATDKKEKDAIFCDWNLDADRGFGYKCWKARNLANPPLSDEAYV